MPKTKNDIEFKEPVKGLNVQVLQLFAELWANDTWRGWLVNQRNSDMAKFRLIKTGKVENDALAVANLNGRLDFAENLIKLQRVAFHDVEKITKPKKEMQVEPESTNNEEQNHERRNTESGYAANGNPGDPIGPGSPSSTDA